MVSVVPLDPCWCGQVCQAKRALTWPGGSTRGIVSFISAFCFITFIQLLDFIASPEMFETRDE